MLEDKSTQIYIFCRPLPTIVDYMKILLTVQRKRRSLIHRKKPPFSKTQTHGGLRTSADLEKERQPAFSTCRLCHNHFTFMV